METAETATHFEPDAVLPAPTGLAVQAFESDATGRLLLSFPLPCGGGRRPRFTRAERAVASDLLLGLSNLEIAQRRRVSIRTIANQVTGLFRKLGVHSRLELALFLASETLEHEENPEGSAPARPRCPF